MTRACLDDLKKLEAVQVKSFEWIVDDFSQTKIQVIGTQKQ
jgi:hypothetical protein